MEKKFGDVDKKYLVSGLLTTIVLNTRITKGENKITNISTLVTTTCLNTKLEKSIIKFLMLVA